MAEHSLDRRHLVRQVGSELLGHIEACLSTLDQVRVSAGEGAPLVPLTSQERDDALARSFAWTLVRLSRRLPLGTVIARLRATADALEAEQRRQLVEQSDPRPNSPEDVGYRRRVA